MATGERNDHPGVDLTMMSGSEAVFDHVCQPCRDDKKTKEAVGFCVNCTYWLCDECFRTHRKPRPSRHHVLRDLEEMKNSMSPPKPADKCTEKCEQHSSKTLKYYCRVHDFLGCSVCVIQGHKTCKVDHIPDVCDCSDVKSELQKVIVNHATIAKDSRDTLSHLNNKIQFIEKSKMEAVDACHRYIKKLREYLEQTGSALEEICVKQAKEEAQKIRHVSKKCEAVVKDSLSIKARLEELEISGQLCNTFIALKQSQGNLKLLENRLEDAKCTSPVTTYTFKPNLAVEKTITDTEGIGSLVEHHSRMDRDYSSVQAHYVGDISVKERGNYTCGITSMVHISPDKLVLADKDNSQVKVLNTRTRKVISSYKDKGTPWAVCKASDSSVAVTIYNKSKILFLSVNATGKLTMTKSIKVNGHCMGVAVIEDKMVVTYAIQDKVEIMDIGGTVLQTIDDPHIVWCPQFVASSPDKKSVYVSNVGNNTVTCMSLDGTLLATYKDSKLQFSEQLAIDSRGMIYLAGYKSNNVHLLTPDCKKVKVILDKSVGLKDVYSVCYCELTNVLYIGIDDCDVVCVFQLL